MMLYVVQRTDCATVAVAGDIDPKYADAVQQARQAGVEMLAYSCDIDHQSITISRPLSVRTTFASRHRTVSPDSSSAIRMAARARS